MLPIHSLITFTLIRCSIYRTEPWITLTTHACTNFFTIQQGSSNFCKTQHVSKCSAEGSRISNMTILCVMKVMRIPLHLHFSAFYILYCTERTVALWTPFLWITTITIITKMSGSLAPMGLTSSPISIAGTAKKLGLLAQVRITDVISDGCLDAQECSQLSSDLAHIVEEEHAILDTRFACLLISWRWLGFGKLTHGRGKNKKDRGDKTMILSDMSSKVLLFSALSTPFPANRIAWTGNPVKIIKPAQHFIIILDGHI